MVTEIFDQVDKTRKQIFKPADRPCEDLKELRIKVECHLVGHAKNKRRWKWAGLIVLVLLLLSLLSFLFALVITKAGI